MHVINRNCSWPSLPGHTLAPRSAGAFVPGAPVASGGGVPNHWLKGGRSATLELGGSMDALDSQPETPIRTDLPPQLPDSQPPTPPTSYRSRYPDAVFTIDYHKGWKTCMAIVMKNFGWQNYCILDRCDNRYEIIDDAGTLESEPFPSSFPLFLMEKKNIPEKSPSVTVRSDGMNEAIPQQPEVAPVKAPNEAEIPPKEAEIPPKKAGVGAKEPEMIAPKEAGVGDQSGANPGVGESKTQKPPPSLNKPVEPSIYADGSYWKSLDIIISSIFLCFGYFPPQKKT